MISLVCQISSFRLAFLLMPQKEVLNTAIGILKQECAVQPPSKRRAAIAEDATQRTGLPICNAPSGVRWSNMDSKGIPRQ
jgi:hypothetical protein